MGVASHLGIKLTEYDSRIRTFIPHYEEMLDVGRRGRSASRPDHRRSRHRHRRAVVPLPDDGDAARSTVGIDVDPEILALASRRLGGRATLRHRFLPSRAAAALRRAGRLVRAASRAHARREGRALSADPRRAAARRRVPERRLAAGDRRLRPARAVRRVARASAPPLHRGAGHGHLYVLVARGRLRAARRRDRAAALGRLPRRAALAPGGVRGPPGGALFQTKIAG